jgi:hypothetical protein
MIWRRSPALPTADCVLDAAAFRRLIEQPQRERTVSPRLLAFLLAACFTVVVYFVTRASGHGLILSMVDIDPSLMLLTG